MNTKLTGIPETLLIPLWSRAVEGVRPNPIVRDPKAAEMVSRIDYDFTKFESAKRSQLGVSIRTMLLDRVVGRFAKAHPEAAVVNLGAGLDTRYERLGPENVDWYELDLPESIDLRRRFFAETDRYRFLSCSVFDTDWLDAVEDTGKPVLLIAEGLLMYFEEKELRPLFTRLVARFPGAEMLMEMLAPFLVGKSKRHDSVSKIDSSAEFKWSLMDSRDLMKWDSRIRYIEEWNYFDYHRDRAGWFGYFARLPFIRPRMASRIVRLRFQGNGA